MQRAGVVRTSSIQTLRGLVVSSEDLISWKQERTLIHHPDIYYHGVQYVDWQFEGEDIVAVVRTAWNDDEGTARNQHDSNYILFHRVEKFAEKR